MRRTIIGGAIALAWLAAGCVYAPKFENGTLQCSLQDNSCPKGYECASDGTCYASTGGVATPSVDNFPGHWIYQTGSTRKITCNDGSVQMKSLKDDYVDIVSAGGMQLVASYYCDWDLDIGQDLTDTSLSLVGQTCSTMSVDGTKFTWHGQTFTFTTTDGNAGTLESSVTSEYTTPDAKTGTCTLELSGTLTNAGPV